MSQLLQARRRWCAGVLFLLFLWVFGAGVTQALASTSLPTAHAFGAQSEQWGTARHAAIAPASATRVQAKAQPPDGCADPAIAPHGASAWLAALQPCLVLPRNAWWPAEQARQRFLARAPPALR